MRKAYDNFAHLVLHFVDFVNIKYHLFMKNFTKFVLKM